MTDDVLGAPGMRALQAERDKNTRLRHQLTATRKELRQTKRQVRWLTATVMRYTNRIVDIAERIDTEGSKSNG